jgi:hypothetical protein
MSLPAAPPSIELIAKAEKLLKAMTEMRSS